MLAKSFRNNTWVLEKEGVLCVASGCLSFLCFLALTAAAPYSVVVLSFLLTMIQ